LRTWAGTRDSVSRAGGASGATELKEAWARDWLAFGRSAYNRDAAAQCRRSAELLRQIVHERG
jgi:hypothetical protein